MILIREHNLQGNSHTKIKAVAGDVIYLINKNIVLLILIEYN